ncbi:MAG: ABC transporter substrate-binding protein, partial [Candidatus Peregrinibacteria bacterium]
MNKKFLSAFILVIVILLGVVFYKTFKTTGVLSEVDLDRPLIVGVVSWPGYAGGIVANGGFQENADSIFTKKYGLPVKFVLIEDIDARGKAFAKGGPAGVDVVWSTVDFWANELPNFVSGGINGKAFLQVDWSRGGDAIVADDSIKTVEDLKGKKIALVQFTPSHWLLESVLSESALTEMDKQNIRNDLVFTQDVPSARATFVAGEVDAAVVWEPDVKQALKKEHSHILISSKEKPDIISDIMVAKQEFINDHPKAIEAFVRGWFDGVEEAKNHPELAARYLMENEPMFADLGLEATKDSLSWVYWPNLEDNARMFGLSGSASVFDDLYTHAGDIWVELKVIDNTIPAALAKDDSILRAIYGA